MAPRENRSIDEIGEFGDVFHPAEAQEPILSRPVRAALLEWLTEIWAADELAAVNLKPRQRALFHGAPGGGKTTLAHHLAARLGLPMVAVRPDCVVDSYLGSTGQRLGRLFDLARPAPLGKGPYVLFFDEFDAIAAKRVGSARDAQREMNNVVNVLLQRIEQHDGFMIAATNHADQLDGAIWRRFDLQIVIGLPGPAERQRIIARYLEPFGLPRRAIEALADATDTATPALLRQLCEGIKRNLVIGPKVSWAMDRDSVVGRVLAAVEPHREVGKPRLWSLGCADPSLSHLPWPLPMAGEVVEDPSPAFLARQPGSSTVVHFGGKS